MDIGSGDRQRFYVELKPGETTIVSWKKLLKDSNNHNHTISVTVQGQPHESTLNVKPEANRLSAVVEKIDRLYVCKQSSDEEELDDVPNDDQYDTEDSFIDDNELDEYFEVDKSTPIYNGYFVNKGQLEHMSEPNLPSNQEPKKRRKNKSRAAEVRKYDSKSYKDVSMYDACADAGGNPPLKLESFMRLDAATDTYETDPERRSQYQLDTSVGSSAMNPDNHDMKSEYSHSKKLARDCFSVKIDKFEEQNPGSSCSKGSIIIKDISASSITTDDIHRGKNVVNHAEPLSDAPTSKTIEPESSVNIFSRDKNTLPDLNYPAPSSETSLKHVKDGPSVGKKGTMLERAIRDLEIIVAQSRPTKTVVPNVDSSFASTKRRLPREVKQKLAKVARLAQSSQGQISEALINRLMNILGHMMQLRTLKRNLREMVLLGLSAKREKADSFEKIKKEVIEMIKLQRSKQQDVTSGNMQESHFEENSMDDALEDKICDLYDLYVHGMDEDKGPQIRKLYVELAELWPSGSIDKHGIKNAISRAKDRRKVLHNHEKDKDKPKRKRVSTIKTEDMTCNKESSNVQPQKAKTSVAPDKRNKMILDPVSIDAAYGPFKFAVPK